MMRTWGTIPLRYSPTLRKVKSFLVDCMANQSPWEALDDLIVVRSDCVTILMILLILISVVGASTQSPRDIEIKDLLKKLNKHPIKTLQSPDGEIIDCVDIYKQPAFDHPLLKNHTIEMSRSFDHGMGDRSNYSSEYAEPIWRQNKSCPKGTIPIRRVMKSDLQVKFLESFGMVHPNPYTATTGRLEVAGATVHGNFPIYNGGGGDLSVWKPSVEREDSSSSSIGVIKSSENYLYAIRVGWMVMPHSHRDGVPRIFVSWMAKEGNDILGCKNLECPGFIQTSPTFVFGSPLHFSRIGNPSLTMLQLKINRGMNRWWVKINDMVVGYYPSEIFTNFDKGTSVDWVGMVWNTMNSGHHTITQMGSGRFGHEGYETAAHFQNMETVLEFGQFRPAERPELEVSSPRCYDAFLYPPPIENYGPSVFFGGPGAWTVISEQAVGSRGLCHGS